MPDDDDLDMTEPHPEVPRDHNNRPVHEDTRERICGLPKKRPDENRKPYCRRVGYWVHLTGACRIHYHRMSDTEPAPRRGEPDHDD